MNSPTDLNSNRVATRAVRFFPFRVLPCDFGHHIDSSIFLNIQRYADAAPDIEILKKSRSIRETELLSARIAFTEGDSVFLTIFSDGTGLFTIKDQEHDFSDVKNFDPRTVLDSRKQSHVELLTQTHLCSQNIQEHISNIRSFFRKEKRRFTSYPEWENNGLSYVMSFYFVDCDINLIKQDSDFQDKVTFLLFPYYGEYRDVCPPMADGALDYEFVKSQFRENFLEIVKKDHDLLPDIHTCVSWSNVLIIGRVNDRIKEEYWDLEKDLQHAWFYTYITDKFIEESLRNISTRTPEKSLELLYQLLTEMIFEINRYEGIVSSTMQERDFGLFNALKASSRLDILVAGLDKKAQLLKDRFNWLLAEKRSRTDKKIEFILFVIALFSAIASWQSFQSLGWYTLGPATGLIVAVAYLFYRPYFFRRK